MVKLHNPQQMQRAVELAKIESKNLLVQRTDTTRKYRVLNRKKGRIYEVTFFVRENRKRFGHCTCRAGELGRVCKHLAAAAGLNLCLAEQGLLNPRPQQQQMT